MTTIVTNMIIEWLDIEDTPVLERVLWVYPKNDYVFVIDINDPVSLPVLRSCTEILLALQQETALRHMVDPYSRLTSHTSISAKHLERRDRTWEKISGLINQEPDIYLQDRRKRLIMQDPVSSKASLDLIYEYLRRFWKRGMVKNALLPDYANCGAPGEERSIKDGKKRGRKPKIAMVESEHVGVNIDADIRRIFNIAFKRYYESKKKNPLRRAYEKMIENHFNHGYRQQGEAKIPITPLAHEVPTLGQFNYWYQKQKNLVHSIVARQGKRVFELRHRAVLGDSTQSAFGPGSIYQIDATLADIYLVSAANRLRIIGRPVVYFCMDTFSKFCVGLHVALEGPSWLTGMMALANTTLDKVSFCAEYGITINSDDWPSCFLPEQITADRGEFIGISSDQLVGSLNIPFANCPPRRGDLKGLVERSFRRANDTVIKWVPGAVRKREQGEHDYRLDATLTLREFTRILILMVIEYNLFHRIGDYPLDRDMMSDGVEPVPIDLWNWGIVNRTGHLRERSPDAVKISLLPREVATVTMQGIRFCGMFYSCERAIREQWFVKARHSGRWSMNASYDPRKIEVIYLHLGNGLLETCQLLPRDERYKDLTIEEILEFQEVQKQNSALHQSRRFSSKGELNAIISAEVGEAQERTESAKTINVSSRQRLKHIRDNRKIEKAQLREEEAWDLRPDSQQEARQTGGDVIVFQPPEQDAVSTSLASVKRKRLLDAIERSEKGGTQSE